MFDPKLTQTDLKDASWGKETVYKSGQPLIPTGDPLADSNYRNFPWEIDASLFPEALEKIIHLTWLHNGNSKQVLSRIRDVKPKSDLELEWAKNRNTWRRYLKVLYSVYNELKSIKDRKAL